MLVFRGITRLADQLCVDIHLLLIEFFCKLDDANVLVIEIYMIEKSHQNVQWITNDDNYVKA